ncbi:hypothetical protein FOA43_000557 [Brettanomyces nanus]|uniref:Uncharacterized protein n=1 Tax=Eeniella nana TaxID=13502 RepID=A0A875S031_EENNA|nr:uncharacterized protein FOA43_000557 [Brettanomyces nanus]QPG73249.1 hypothetical protein FOA43_000557 [Brettanomyces nanus]
MFSAETTDKDVEDKLKLVCKVYQLPAVLDPSKAVLDSTVSVENYQKSIFPSNIYSDEFMSERSSAHPQPATMVVGQSIANNSGIPLNSINKLPSYQWSFKHEDDHKSHHYGHSHHHHKGKNILNGLGTSESISLLGGTFFNSTALNSRLIRLPVMNESNRYKKRSILNGLPYYDKSIIDKQIRAMNIEKVKLKLPVANASHFSASFNETVDDVEYLHGEVILNQFMNNKRIMRDYQWMLYYLNRFGGKNLTENGELKFGRNKIVSVKTWKQFEKWTMKRQEKFKEMHKIRMEIAEKRHHRKEANMKRLTDKARVKEIKRNLEEASVDFDVKSSGEFFSTEESNNNGNADEQQVEEYTAEEKDEEEKDRTMEALLPEFEDEVTISDEELEEVEELEDTHSEQVSFPDREIVIERELPVDDPELLKYQRILFGIPSSNQMELQIQNSNGVLQTKRVRVKRVPNPNALGYSNIRHRKPSYL